MARASDPRRAGKAFVGSTLGSFWRCRAGGYRVVAEIQDRTVTVVIVVSIGHRGEVYRS